MFPRARGVTFFPSILFKKFISVNSYLNVLTFKVTTFGNSSVSNIFMVEESKSSRKESSITFPPLKTGTNHVNEERETVAPVNSSSNAKPGYSKNSQTEDLINSISALINKKLTEFRSEMITMINKNGDQPASLGDGDFILL